MVMKLIVYFLIYVFLKILLTFFYNYSLACSAIFEELSSKLQPSSTKEQGITEVIKPTEAQAMALERFNQYLAVNKEKGSFLHIDSISSERSTILTRSLKAKILLSEKKISLVTAYQVSLVEQLFETISREFKTNNTDSDSYNNKKKKEQLKKKQKSTENLV